MKLSFNFISQKPTWAGMLLTLLLFWGQAASTAAHPANPDLLPTTSGQGLLMGLIHPWMSVEHLLFIVIVGFLCSSKDRGGWVPIAFIGAGVLGTWLHVYDASLPNLDIALALSVVLLGVMLIATRFSSFILLTLLSAIAGLLHGYASGGIVTQAAPLPLTTYLLGFGMMQLVIAFISLLAGRFIHDLQPLRFSAWMQWMGIGICTIGAIGAVLL